MIAEIETRLEAIVIAIVNHITAAVGVVEVTTTMSESESHASLVAESGIVGMAIGDLIVLGMNHVVVLLEEEQRFGTDMDQDLLPRRHRLLHYQMGIQEEAEVEIGKMIGIDVMVEEVDVIGSVDVVVERTMDLIVRGGGVLDLSHS
jgi:hypothetical protein